MPAARKFSSAPSRRSTTEITFKIAHPDLPGLAHRLHRRAAGSSDVLEEDDARSILQAAIDPLVGAVSFDLLADKETAYRLRRPTAQAERGNDRDRPGLQPSDAIDIRRP